MCDSWLQFIRIGRLGRATGYSDTHNPGHSTMAGWFSAKPFDEQIGNDPFAFLPFGFVETDFG